LSDSNDAVTAGQETPRPTVTLQHAIERALTRQVQAHIHWGSDVNAKSDEGEPLLHLAVRKADEPICRILLDADADPNAQDRDGVTPLERAVQQGSTPIVQLLLGAGVDPDAASTPERSPLRVAKDLGLDRIAALIADAGGTAPPVRPKVSLFEAVRAGDVEQVRSHIYWGSDLNEANSYGYRSLDFAIRGGSPEIAEILSANGAECSPPVTTPVPPVVPKPRRSTSGVVILLRIVLIVLAAVAGKLLASAFR
jgi:ankyrin repeat protein